MRTARTRGMMVGCIGGLVGTIVMDLFGGVLFLLMGGPASLSFAVIGDAAAAFLAMLGITMAGGTPLGALLHYLIGLVFGALFGAAVSRIAVLRLDSLKKAIGFGILYVEVMSLPLLAAAAWVLHMTAAETAQWFGISFVMHLVYGLVLGLVAYYGLRAAPAARQR
ncbi:MAG TPA: hypothetical protein VFU22_25140 [Roseiflexaceae bacterium]|nr:hypothetical protein [Roseiflexaceae bacterium]